MIFDSLRDRFIVTVDTGTKRRRKSASKPTPKREPERKKRATPAAAVKRTLPKRVPDSHERHERQEATRRRSTTGGLFYGTGRDGATGGYPRLSGLAGHDKPRGKGKAGHTFFYWIDIDERGEFSAHVDNPHGKTVFEIPNAEAMEDLIQDGFMRHTSDIDGLAEYLQDMGVMAKGDTLVESNWYMDDYDEDETDEEGETVFHEMQGLGDYTQADIEMVRTMNSLLKQFDKHSGGVVFRVYSTGSKKTRYLLRRYEIDASAYNANVINGKPRKHMEGIRRDTSGFIQTFTEGFFDANSSLLKPIAMGPKSANKYFEKYYGFTWDDFVAVAKKWALDGSEGSYARFNALCGKADRHREQWQAENREKMQSVSQRQSEREERIAKTRAEREESKREREQRIAARKAEREQRRERTSAPKVQLMPQAKPAAEVEMPKPLPEAPRKERKPRAQKESRPVVEMVEPKQAPRTEPSDATLDSIEADIANLTKLLQAAAQAK
ncbi:MAG: hypothetical protein FGM22_07290 [Burkholderiaceae bacterium]|nr:hypothetical protein [Burkholderiaceae bacterium]